ncbi:MAG: hypothetical protein KC613_25035, partial [Myxococcales bacterium]|nr:hypothetical protein [Myxococcales bacterium]
MPTRGLIPLTLLITAGLAHGEPPCLDPLIERVSLRLRTAPAGLRPRLAPVPDPALTSHALRLQADAGELDLDWTDAQAVEALLADTVRATRAAEPEHGADMLAVYTAGPVDRAPFYLPLANDVRGIGYGRLGLAPTETFRSAVDPRLDGVAFLGDLPTALAEPVEAERLFLHELGHRWGVYVHLADGGDALLGRNCRHWSAFVDAGDAPLEGHRWSPVAGGWRADAPQPPLRYAPLTRYLMGLIPLDEVPPIERLAVAAPPCDEPARNGEPNPRWRALGPADPPWVQTAERVAHPAAQVVAAEGPRLPA